MKNNPKMIIIHCSDVQETVLYNQFNSINNYHRDDRGFPESSIKGNFVGYHSLITGGINYKCKEDNDIGAHCNQVVDGLSVNFQSLGVCVGFDGDVEYMSQIHYNLLQKQVWVWQDKYNIPDSKVYFHRYFATTKTCPGVLLSEEWLKKLLKRDVTIPTESCTAEKAVIAEQKKQIWRLQELVKDFINFLKGK